MSRTCQIFLARAASVLMLATAGGNACHAQAHPPTITVTVYNRSPLSPGVVRTGEQVASDILREAGVESVWVDCLAPGGKSPSSVDCRQAPSHTRLVLTIVPRWRGSLADSDTLGLAAQNEHGDGVYCYVFQEKLDELVRATHISASALLGHAIAHELGHLLEGSNSHAPEGVMAARWDAAQITRASRGALGFTARDKLVILRRLSAAFGPATLAVDLANHHAAE